MQRASFLSSGSCIDPHLGARSRALISKFWQANSAGRYAHPDRHEPRFRSIPISRDPRNNDRAHGRYQFKTIKPLHYPAAPGMSSGRPISILM